MYPTLLTILFTLFAILAWRNLRLGLILLSGLLPVYLLRFSIGPIPSTALEIMILICAVVWMIKLIWPDSPLSHLDTPLSHPDDRRDLLVWLYPTILLLIASIIGIIIAPDTFLALGIWKAYFIEPILVAIMMLSTFNKKDWCRCLQALSITAIALSIFAIFQYLTGVGIPIPWDIELRATSIFDYPNALGLFLAPIVVFNSILIIRHNPLPLPLKKGERPHFELPSFLRRGWLCRSEALQSEGRGWLSLISIILGLIAIILSQTEAALVAIPSAVIITLLISNISKKKKLVLLVLSVTLVLFSLLIPFSREKLLLQDYSGQVRLSQLGETMELIKDNPIFGVGLNGYPTALEPYHDSTLYEIFQYPHNIFLNTWSELGILGLIALFWFGFLILKTISRNLKTSPNVEVVTFAIFSALLTIFIHGLVDVPYFKNDLAVLTWILLIAYIALSYQKKSI